MNRDTRRCFRAERYATGFVAALHLESGRFCYTNAGHNAALLLRATGEHEELAASGLPLGLLPAGDYERQERRLEPGDLVLVYTDGVTEAANPAGEEYGLERLPAAAPALSASALVVAVVRPEGLAFAARRTAKSLGPS